ncbi:MAG TPA: helix-turn-helix transcriptional regulator, partial [Verrucomicrobiae bacterium]|nr:helix-turn-helix transcriptional regulator [Verrucomicrobiae bacterium]
MPKALTIRSFLPQCEIDICHRFRQVRIEQGLDQRELAERLEISRSRIASYEYAKAPLRYGIANKFCTLFHVNQRWLATGELPPLPYFPIAEALATKIDDRALFSGVFHNLLDVHLAESEAELREKIGDRGYYTGDFEISALKEISSVGNSTRNPLVVA